MRSRPLFAALLLCFAGCDRSTDPPPAANAPTPVAKPSSQGAGPSPGADPPKSAKRPKAPGLVASNDAAAQNHEFSAGGTAITLPATGMPLAPVPAAPIVHVSTTAIELGEHMIAPINAGKIESPHVERHLIGVLFDQLAEIADKEKTIAERQGEQWDARLVVAVDADVSFDAIVDILYTSGRAEFRAYDFAALTDTDEVGVVPLSPPRLGAAAFGAPGAPEAPKLLVALDSGGYGVVTSSPDASPGRIGVRAAKGHDAWDYGALTEHARAHVARHPTATMARVQPEGDTPMGVVIRTFAALRGPECAANDRCVLRTVVVEAPRQ